MIEVDIINGCKRKDEKAYKQCYELYAPYVYSIIKNYISDNDYRRDAMQEVFSQVFISINNYDANKGAFKSWIAQLTIYQSISLLRKQKRLNIFVPLDSNTDVVEVNDSLDQLTKEELNQMLAHMPEGYKTVFLLSVIDGYKHEEIANLLGISVGASRSQLSRSLKWIKKNISLETKNYIYG